MPQIHSVFPLCKAKDRTGRRKGTGKGKSSRKDGRERKPREKSLSKSREALLDPASQGNSTVVTSWVLSVHGVFLQKTSYTKQKNVDRLKIILSSLHVYMHLFKLVKYGHDVFILSDIFLRFSRTHLYAIQLHLLSHEFSTNQYLVKNSPQLVWRIFPSVLSSIFAPIFMISRIRISISSPFIGTAHSGVVLFSVVVCSGYFVSISIYLFSTAHYICIQ